MVTQKFKQTEMGKIPEDWERVEFVELLLEKTRNGIYKNKEFHGRGIKIINMKELFAFDRINNQEMKLIELTKSEKERFIVQRGDLLFARRSLTAYGAGKCSLIEEGEERTFESSMILARPNPKKSNSEFLFYLFSSKYGKSLMQSILRQVAVSGITGTDLMKLEILTPPLPEQKAIASILSSLDSKIELNNKMNKTLEAIGQAIFNSWFIEFRFTNGEEVELGKYIEFVKGKKPKDVSDTKIELYKNQILIENLNGIKSLYANPENTVEVKIYEPIMVMDGASSGRIEIGHEGILGSTLAKIIPNENNLSSFFIYYFLKNHEADINSNTTGTSIPHADKNKIKMLEFSLPPKKKLKEFDNIAKSLTDKIILNKKQTKTLSQIRDTLLPKLMSGDVRVK